MGSFFDRMKEPPIKLGEPYPLFTRVSVDTAGGCTRGCVFCPQHGKKPRPPMSEDLYASVVEQLGELTFSGTLQMWYLGEPMLDKRLEEHTRAARSACPLANIFICSNGDLLESKDQVDQLLDAGANNVNFNAYDARALARLRDLLPDAASTATWGRVPRSARIVSVVDLTAPVKLHDWTAPDVKERMARTVEAKRPWAVSTKTTGRCARPHRHIVIACDGRVPLCCAKDYYSVKEWMGDANSERLIDIWNSVAMHGYRRMLQDGVRERECAGCRATMAFPHVVRRVE